MEVNEAIRTRRSIHSYRSEPVPRNLLEEIVETCRWSPSPGNMQPWEFAILGGETMKELKKRLAEKIAVGAASELEFNHPLNVPEVYDKRREDRKAVMNAYLYPPGTANIEEKKREYFVRGGRMFDAPNAIIIYTEKRSLEIPWLAIGLGIMAQSVCLAAHSHGIATCIMGRPVDWPNILREMLQIPTSKVFVVGIAMGYAVTDDKVNTFPRTRVPLESWIHWYGF